MLRFVINLDRSKDRLDAITGKLDALGIDFQRVSAVDGSKISEEQKKELLYPIDHFETKVRFTRELTNGEIGCFLSHRECWKRLLDSDEKWALIMEDDIDISSRAQEYLKSEDWIPNGVKICQLSAQKRIIDGKIAVGSCKVVSEVACLVIPVDPPPLGTMAYLISREAAQLAVSMSDKLPAPVDNFLFSYWFYFSRIVPTYRISPVLVVPASNTDSVVGDRTKKTVKKAPFLIRHGLTRFILDREVQKHQMAGEEFRFSFVE